MQTRAYRNLNKRDAVVYSMQTKQRNKNDKLAWKVTDYVHAIILQNCKLKHATPAALQRIRSGAREVCQWIQGDYVSSISDEHKSESIGYSVNASFQNEWKQLIADPKRADGFCDAETGERIDCAEFVKLNQSGAFYA